MKFENPLTMNDWRIRKFMIVAWTLQMAILFTAMWEHLGLETFPIRQLVGIAYSLLVPGMLILRIMRLHNLGSVRTLLYSVGLGLVILMFTGAVLNLLGPVLGLTNPLTTMPITLSLAIVVLVLSILCYMRDNESHEPSLVDTDKLNLAHIALFGLIIWLTLEGVFLLSILGSNIMLLITLSLVASMLVLMGFTSKISVNLYPIAIFAVSISLLLHSSLFSNYLWGWDVQQEYYVANLVVANSHWDTSIPYNINGMLSIVMLAPVLSSLCGMDLIWTFKLIFPAVYSLVPVGLYVLYQTQFKARVAFFSAMFFASFSVFYLMMVSLARQEVAEVFLVLSLLLLFDGKIVGFNRSLLLLVFGFSLIVSHYGLSYLFIVSVMAVLLLQAIDHSKARLNDRGKLSPSYVFFFVACAFIWYTLVSSASSFNSAFGILGNMAGALGREFFSPNTSEGLAIVMAQPLSPLHLFAEYLYLTSLALVGIGVLFSILKRRNSAISGSFLRFSAVAIAVLAGAISIPYLLSSLGTYRVFHISLFFLAPFLFIGINWIFEKASDVFRTGLSMGRLVHLRCGLPALFLGLFFLFNTGFVYEVAHDHPVSIPLDPALDGPHYNDMEVSAARWLLDESSSGPIYGDAYRWLVIGSFDWARASDLSAHISDLPAGSLIFLGTNNIQTHSVIVVTTVGASRQYHYIDTQDWLTERGMIFNNGGAVGYY